MDVLRGQPPSELQRLPFREERPAGRAQLLAKRGSFGQMQISAELAPIPDASRMRPDASGCVGILNSSKFRRILVKFRQYLTKTQLKLAKHKKTFQQFFKQKLESRKRCKGLHCVDLGESFPTSIHLQNLASTQPRTSPVKSASSSSRKC